MQKTNNNYCDEQSAITFYVTQWHISSVLDLWYTGRGFNSWLGSGRHCVLALVKLLTPVHLCHKQYNLVPPKEMISLAGKVKRGPGGK